MDKRMLKTLYIFMFFLFPISCAMAYEYKNVTEDEIKKLLEETKAKSGIKLTRTPYKIEILDPYKKTESGRYLQTTYYFTDTGHFAHPSVVIKRETMKEVRGQPITDSKLVALTAKDRKHVEKWIQVIRKTDYSFERKKKKGADPRPFCAEYDMESQPKESLKCYEKVARDNPDSLAAQYFLGIFYIYADDEMSTRKQYEKLKELSVLDAFYFVGFGVGVMKPEWLDYYQQDQKQVERVSEAQMLLDSLGYDTGSLPVGVIVPKLEEAIRAFQRDAKLNVDGEITESLLEKLRTWKK